MLWSQTNITVQYYQTQLISTKNALFCSYLVREKIVQHFFRSSMSFYSIEMFLLHLLSVFFLEPTIFQNHKLLALDDVFILKNILRNELIKFFKCMTNMKFLCGETVHLWIYFIFTNPWIYLSNFRLIRKFLSMMHKNFRRIFFSGNGYSFDLIIHNLLT